MECRRALFQNVQGYGSKCKVGIKLRLYDVASDLLYVEFLPVKTTYANSRIYLWDEFPTGYKIWFHKFSTFEYEWNFHYMQVEMIPTYFVFTLTSPFSILIQVRLDLELLTKPMNEISSNLRVTYENSANPTFKDNRNFRMAVGAMREVSGSLWASIRWWNQLPSNFWQISIGGVQMKIILDISDRPIIELKMTNYAELTSYIKTKYIQYYTTTFIRLEEIQTQWNFN